MATAIADCAQAREDHFVRYGKRPAIIADGGMGVGGDICKAIACGADWSVRIERAPGAPASHP
jgi:IMP dehydrogenase